MPDNPITQAPESNEDVLPPNTFKVFPAKSFFVDMLTRDIDLADAIVDLLDNCVDGVRRLKRSTTDSGAHDSGGVHLPRSYDGFWAHIEYDGSKFKIEDNCGGISLEDAVNYAFRFGKTADFVSTSDGTIGLVGIGMKRALLKMGSFSTVHSHHSKDTYQVQITPEWLANDDDWKLHYDIVEPVLADFGTRIEVTELADSVHEQFQSSSFYKKLWEKVEGAFSLLISHGFEVKINGQLVTSETLSLLYQEGPEHERGIRPFVYRDNIDGVDIYLIVGFRRQDKESSEEEDAQRYYRSTASGWTVSCNDRVVLYRDKSEQTGWGTDSVPEYHTQFIAVSGFAEFRSDDPRKLPFTTTKFGVNQQAGVYIRVFDIMREGTRIFTDWTNKFKNHLVQRDEVFASAASVPVEKIRSYYTLPARREDGTQVPVKQRPKLPQTKTERTEQTISFKRLASEIRTVSEFLSGDSDMPATQVGSQCFDRVLREALK